MNKVYKVFLEDGIGEFAATVVTTSKRKAREYVAGNGRVVAIEDITENHPISINKVEDALSSAGFGKTEIYIIRKALQDSIDTKL